MKKRSDKIYVRVIRNGYIPQLGIQGPIPNPIKISRGTAHSMIVAGIEVHEVDPKTKITKKLTVENVFEDAPSAPVKEPVPEKKPSDPVKPIELNGVKKDEKKDEKANEVKKAEPEKNEETPATTEGTSDEKKEESTDNKNKNSDNKNNKKK